MKINKTISIDDYLVDAIKVCFPLSSFSLIIDVMVREYFHVHNIDIEKFRS